MNFSEAFSFSQPIKRTGTVAKQQDLTCDDYKVSVLNFVTDIIVQHGVRVDMWPYLSD